MHYFKRHIGDYAKKAGRLSMLQHGAYTLLVDACYDREQFPSLGEAIEWTWASSDAEIDAVKFVLSKFFVLADGVYVHESIKNDIENYYETAAINKRIAMEREAKRRENATNRDENSTERERSVNVASPDVHEPPPNHKPLTTNQEPRTKKKTKSKTLNLAGFDEFWKSYPKKTRKGYAEIAWSEADLPPIEVIISSLDWQKLSHNWVKDGGQFIPAPANWIKDKCWLDEKPEQKRKVAL